jgi:hypothetical protein
MPGAPSPPRAASPSPLVRRALTRHRPAPSPSYPSRNGRAPRSPPSLNGGRRRAAAHRLARASSPPLTTYKSLPEHLSTSHRSLELFFSSAPPPQGSSTEQGPAGRT